MNLKDWPKLMGMPHESGQHDWRTGKLDCLGVVKTLRLWSGLDTPDYGSERWRSIGTDVSVAQETDVIVSDPDLVGAATHCACVVAAGYRGAALTSSERRGVIVQRNWEIRNVIGVYRLAE